jgi:M6 family metalloprotease-like protein
MADFPNLAGPATIGSLPARTYYDNLLFGNHPSNATNGSMKDYYTEVSYNQLTVLGQVNTGTTNWYRMPQSSTAYGDGNGGNTTQILIDAVAAANSAGFDFGPLDNDNDGYADAIFVVRADSGRAYASTLNIPTGDVNASGTLSTRDRRHLRRPMTTIEIFAHELAITLGRLICTISMSHPRARSGASAHGFTNGR